MAASRWRSALIAALRVSIFVGAVVPLSIDEEGGSAGDTAEIGRFDVLGDAGGVGTDIEVIAEAGGVEIQALGIAQQVVAGEGVLVSQEQVVHGPEGALGGGGFGGLGG